VDKLIISTGPSFSDPSMTSEKIDYYANINIISQFTTYLNEIKSASYTYKNDRDDKDDRDDRDDRDVTNIVNFKKELLNLSQWVRLDDVIMGGKFVIF